MSTTIDPAVALADINTWADGPPYGLLDTLRERGPIVWIPGEWGTNGCDGYWGVFGHPEISHVTKNPEIFTSSQGAAYPVFPWDLEALVNNMVTQDDPGHARLRAHATGPLTPRVVARFDSWVRAVVCECLDKVAAADHFDGIDDVAAVIPARVICDLMGVPAEDRERVLGFIFALFERDTPEGMERAKAGSENLMKYGGELRAIKRRNPGVDFTSELVAAEKQGAPISDAEFQDLVFTILGAGFETTHTLIAQSLRMMIDDSELDAQVRTAVRAGRLREVTEEFLRWISPVMNMARSAVSDTELGGKEIKAGQRVVMWYAAANRDPRVFDDPHRFIATRSPNKHFAFGAPGGPHFCLGHALGRLQGQIFLEELVARDLKFEFAGDPVSKGGVFINALKQFPLSVVR